MTGVDVELTRRDVQYAAEVGIARQVEALFVGHTNPATVGAGRASGWHKHIIGAIGELAFARYTGRPPPTTVFHNGNYDTLVTALAANGDSRRVSVDFEPDIQIKTTDHPNGGLLVRPRDLDDHRFVLVIVDERRVRIVGHCVGADAKQDRYLDRPDPRRQPCWLVPQTDLKPIDRFGELCGGVSL